MEAVAGGASVRPLSHNETLSQRSEWSTARSFLPFHPFNIVILSGEQGLACESLREVERPAVRLRHESVCRAIPKHRRSRLSSAESRSLGCARDDSGEKARRRYPELLQCLDRSPPFPGSNVVALELAIKRGPADAQHLARERLVTLHLLEDPLDGGALNVLKVGRGQPG
jgi:hypothetical protein